VDPATVSYVLNNTAPVSEETRGRVLAAAAELGYRRNLPAASMRRNTTQTIGLILPNISTPFYRELAHGVESVRQEHACIVTYGNTTYQAQLTAQAFADRRVDGVIVAACTDEDMEVLQGHDILYSALMAPPLTTVSQPKYPMGVVAMRLLREAMVQKDQRL
jgi:LacI family transcriptional regulator